MGRGPALAGGKTNSPPGDPVKRVRHPVKVEGGGSCSGGRAPGEGGGAPGEGVGSCPGSGEPGEVGGSELGFGGDVAG
jgi:hypothetical protein